MSEYGIVNQGKIESGYAEKISADMYVVSYKPYLWPTLIQEYGVLQCGAGQPKLWSWVKMCHGRESPFNKVLLWSLFCFYF